MFIYLKMFFTLQQCIIDFTTYNVIYIFVVDMTTF